MRYRRFGRSGLDVSELVFGGGWVGGILIHQDEDTRREALRRALGAGINWIDTAPSYGEGRSEEALGRLLPEMESRPYVSTKVGLDTSRLDDVAGQVERSVAESLARLRRDSVDLLQLHNPIEARATDRAVGAGDVLRPGGIADALDRVREQGLTRLVGITALGSAPSLVEVIDSARFDSAQVYYNAINPSAAWASPPSGWSAHDFSGVLAACHRADTAAMCIRVLAAGVLATDLRHGREIPVTRDTDLAREEARARAVADLLGDDYGTRAQAAIRFALANPDLACVVVGMAELAHLEEALAAEEMGPLPEEALARLARLAQHDFA